MVADGAKNGRVVHSDGRVLTYGELTKGQKLTGVVSEQAIGVRARRVEGARHGREEGERARRS